MKNNLEAHNLNLAVSASILAGQSILGVYNTEFEVELKEDNSPLTMADKKSHEVISRHLQTTGLPILSEEGREISYDTRSLWQYYWLIDPLDGTKEFIKRNGEFTVNVALMHETKPVILCRVWRSSTFPFDLKPAPLIIRNAKLDLWPNSLSSAQA